MRKILTRLATLFVILIVMISFSACSLFTTDLDKKYSATIKIATAENDDISISRRELYYGYEDLCYEDERYEQYKEMSQSEKSQFLESLTSLLLNEKILEKKSIELYGEIRDSEKALARKLAFDSLNTKIRNELKIEESDQETDESSVEVDKPYEPSILVSYENGERVFTMDLTVYEDVDSTGTLSLSDYETYIPLIPGASSQDNAKRAISKIVREFQSSENGFTELETPKTDYLANNSVYFKHLSQDERDTLNRKIDRMIRSNEISIVGGRISVGYNLGMFTLDKDAAKTAWDAYLTRGQNFTAWMNNINGIQDANTNEPEPAYFGCGRTVATNIANNAIEYYINQGIKAINNQSNFSKDDDLESTLVTNGLADVYYIPGDVAENLFTVSHILVGFTEEQKTKYKNINDEASKNPVYNKQNDLNKLYAETMSNGLSADEILIKLNAELSNADSLQQKYDVFRTFINEYNTDPGMQNLDQLNSSTNKQQYEYVMSGDAGKNQMVEEFTNASIELFKDGEKGAISGLVWTEYGAHIIMYTRDVSDFIYTGVKGLEKESIELLKMNYDDTLFATLTSYGQRTLFNTIIVSYFTRNVSKHQTNILNDYRHEHQITIVNSEFKNFI